jgi:hypothetical protein
MTTILVPRGARLLDALPDHRVAPGGVRADQHDEVGRVEVVVGARHHVLAEGAVVRRHREAMHSRELVSMLPLPMKPFISLLAT